MDTTLRELRQAARSLRGHLGFTVAATLMLAIGVGSTSGVFSVVYAVLLHPFPYSESHRIVRLFEQYEEVTAPRGGRYLTNVTYYAWKDSPSATLEDIAAYRVREHTLTLNDASARAVGAEISPSTFPVLGVSPAIGRGFDPDETTAMQQPELVLTDGLWREWFAADPAVVGRSVRMDGVPHTIVGVAPTGFYFPDREIRFWVPLTVPRPIGTNPTVTLFFAIGRLRGDATAAQAEAEGTARLRAVGTMPLGVTVASGNGGSATIRAVTLVDGLAADLKPALAFVSAAAGFLLLIVCANLANLVFSHGLAREREFAVRAALGASRGHLMVQLLAEGLLTSIPGAVLGLLIAYWVINIVRLYAPPDVPRVAEVDLNIHVLLLAVGVAMGVSILAAILPAMRISRSDRVAQSGQTGRPGVSSSHMRRTQRFRSALVTVEAACAALVIVATALLGRSFAQLLAVDPGYTADRVLTARVFIPGGESETTRRWYVMQQLLKRLRGLPDVVAAGAGNMMPFDPANFSAGFPVPGAYRRELPPGVSPQVAVSLQYAVTPGYAEALGLRLVRGRFFSEPDLFSDRALWMVNEEFARQYLPPDPVGMVFPWTVDDRDAELEIVGMVQNTLKDGLDRQPQPEFYKVLKSGIWGDIKLVIRTAGAPALRAPTVLALVRDVAPEAAVEALPLTERLARSVARPRFLTIVSLVFAALAIALACGGLAAVLAHNLAQRQLELGIRAALGASGGHLLRMVLWEAASQTLLGVLMGLVAAAVFTRYMDTLLFGVAPLDATAFAVPVVVLLPLAAVSALPRALHAMRADPARALRCE